MLLSKHIKGISDIAYVTLEISNPDWFAKEIQCNPETVASVAFNEAADTTEVTFKPGANVVAGFFEEEATKPYPVKGTVAEVKTKLGMK